MLPPDGFVRYIAAREAQQVPAAAPAVDRRLDLDTSKLPVSTCSLWKEMGFRFDIYIPKIVSSMKSQSLTPASTLKVGQYFSQIANSSKPAGLQQPWSSPTQQTLTQTPAPTEKTNMTGPQKRHVFRCPHSDQKHYAKGMCNHCYHIYGRNKMAFNCAHSNKLVYARGLCQKCYYYQYNNLKKIRTIK